MLDIRDAAKAVMSYLDAVGELVDTSGARLEEFEVDQDTGTWTLTFSFEDLYSSQRKFKVFEVDDDGKVLSMKFRQASEAVPF